MLSKGRDKAAVNSGKQGRTGRIRSSVSQCGLLLIKMTHSGGGVEVAGGRGWGLGGQTQFHPSLAFGSNCKCTVM